MTEIKIETDAEIIALDEAKAMDDADLQRFKVSDEESCTECGACCAPAGSAPAHDDGGYVELTTGDVIAMGLFPEGRDQDLVVTKLGPSLNTSGFYLRVLKLSAYGHAETRCPLLQGEVGEMTGCAVYQNRPHACQSFRRNCHNCLRFRRSRNFTTDRLATRVEE